MASERSILKIILKASAWIFLGLGIVVFYATYVTANTYYSPVGTLVIAVLGALIILLGVVESYLSYRRPHRSVDTDRIPTMRVLNRIPRLFWRLLIITMALTVADMTLTTYAISTFGTFLEGNQAVAQLLAVGDFYTWMGQQFAPLVIAGALFGIIKRPNPRIALSFYVIGTAVYAAVIVVNNAVVLARLTF